MCELKRTQLYEAHLACGGQMVDFGGWEMPIQYPSGIVTEHLATRSGCGIFDVSHMGRLLIEGPDRLAQDLRLADYHFQPQNLLVVSVASALVQL